MTNRDLYTAIGELGQRYASSARTLEQYLSALLGLTRHHRARSTVSISDFYELLCEAFTADPVSFDPAWREQYAALDPDQPGFVGWEATLIRQIVDLHEMEEAGTLKNKYRYFGVNAPRGSRWYNFDPAGYLECAMDGSLGGWEPGDPTGRDFVPGQVAVISSQGTVESVDPQDLERPVVDLPGLSWDQFQNFIVCGQIYE